MTLKQAFGLRLSRERRHKAAAEASTGIAGHYHLGPIVAGKYVLFGWWTVGDKTYRWWSPISVAASPMHRDLDNHAVADLSDICLWAAMLK